MAKRNSPDFVWGEGMSTPTTPRGNARRPENAPAYPSADPKGDAERTRRTVVPVKGPGTPV